MRRRRPWLQAGDVPVNEPSDDELAKLLVLALPAIRLTLPRVGEHLINGLRAVLDEAKRAQPVLDACRQFSAACRFREGEDDKSPEWQQRNAAAYALLWRAIIEWDGGTTPEWTPTSESIAALPRGIRGYVQELQRQAMLAHAALDGAFV
jgi:hypothetical protein